MNGIKIVLPECSDDFISEGLRHITKLLSESGADTGAGCLGGKYGYGAVYDSPVFSMHPYCWCEKDKCQWCSGDAPNFLHKPTGFSVIWYKYIGRGMEIKNPNDADFVKILAECVKSINEGPRL